jgi:Spy/CpxP family protein refolding chaperone
LLTPRQDRTMPRVFERAKELGLTPEQKEKIKAILHKYLGGMHSIHQNAELSAEEKMAKINTIRDEIRAEFKKVMTPEQYAMWKEKEGQTLPGAQIGLQQLQGVIESLNLSDEQKEKLRDFHEQQMGKLQALRDDLSLTLSEKLEKIRAMRQDVDPKLKEVLTAEQFEKWQDGVNKWFSQIQAPAKPE